MTNVNFCSKRWIYEQYDSSVMGDTISIGNKTSSSIVKIHGSYKCKTPSKAIAISTDCNSRYVKNDPILGGKIIVAEAARNLICSGAKPLAITNNLNFGNPEKKEIMGQIVGSILGIKEACEALKTPVVSGNVSLYNETDGSSILPTPVIGMIGLVQDLNKIIKINSNKDQTIYLIGQSNEKLNGFLQSSLYQEIFFASFEGQVPPINLKQEKKIHDFILKLNSLDIIKSANDVSEGGFLPCLLEMLFSKQLGISINIPSALSNLNKSELYKLHGWLFGEDQGRILISTTENKIFELEAKKQDIKFFKLGKTDISGIVEIGKYDNISINECYKLYDKSLSDQVS